MELREEKIYSGRAVGGPKLTSKRRRGEDDLEHLLSREFVTWITWNQESYNVI